MTDAIKRETIERCLKAVASARFGAPSNWGSDRPKGWHLDRPCTPEEASHHDNGCNDAFMAILALQEPSERAKLKCPGVGRDKDCISALQFYFSRPVTNNEMRFLHEVMQRAVASMPRELPDAE